MGSPASCNVPQSQSLQISPKVDHAEHSKELLHHLSIAHGSLAEVETHIQVAERLNYINSDEVLRMLDETAEIGRMLNGLSRSIGRRS